MNLFPYTSNNLFILYANGDERLFNLLPWLYIAALLGLAAVYFFLFWKDQKKQVFVATSIIAILCTIFFSESLPSLNKISTYIWVGEYLRDVKGINIFSGDWSSWILSMMPLDTLMYALVLRGVWSLTSRSLKLETAEPVLPKKKKK